MRTARALTVSQKNCKKNAKKKKKFRGGYLVPGGGAYLVPGGGHT